MRIPWPLVRKMLLTVFAIYLIGGAIMFSVQLLENLDLATPITVGGAALLAMSAAGYCPFYQALSIDNARKGTAQPSDYYDEGVHVGVRLGSVDGLRLFDLGNDAYAARLPVQALAQVANILGGAHERERNHVDTHLQAKGEIGDVLLRERWGADLNAGKVDAFVIADLAATHYFAAD